MSSTKLRFAPSPTGYVHIGNIRTAVLNWLFARQSGGTFVLRFDDTDTERARAEYADGIREDLTWLGLTWDELVSQSDRTELYAAAADRLKAAGRLYPCYETPDEIERKRRIQRAQSLPPIYDRAALRLTEDERAALEAEGRKPHWRFRLDNTGGDPDSAPVATPVTWDDLIRGPQSVDAGSLSDPVLIREDGSFLYTFTSVIDDAEMGITHIVRGEDHVTNSGVQIQIFEALGASPPEFAHHSLLVGADGAALSKRMGDLAIRNFREQGLEPQSVLSLAALVGTSDPIEPHLDGSELVDMFAFAKISRSPARFDARELEVLNAKLLQTLPYSDVADRLAALGVEGGEQFWHAIRANVSVLADVVAWWRVVTGPIAPVIEDADHCRTAAELLPPGEPTDETWSLWTGEVKARTGAKGKALFQPLRLALTGQPSGPEMKLMLTLIGRDKAIKRLSGESA